MSRSLLIVESPTKVKTIEKILGKKYHVLSSNGHVIDLPAKELAIEPEKGFALKNRVIPSKRQVLSRITKAAREADSVLMATDPDREGEAIAYLLAKHLKLPEDRVFRVMFHEITRKGIQEALEKPGHLDAQKFHAQQARRAIDRLVGYKLSPVLWKKIRRGLSAGRVQSVALRLVCEREKEIRAFRPEDYFLIYSHLSTGKPPSVKARLVSVQDLRLDLKGARLTDPSRAAAIQDDLRRQAYAVTEVQVKEARKSPPPPFITSTLQQEAARKLRFTAKKTMMVAQQLYEGVSLGERGTTGLITYMRTDSVRISTEAIQGARQEVVRRFGDQYLPKSPRAYRNRKGAQDAHEAIRPASPELDPGEAAAHLDRDQARLYELIYKRFLASQMADQLLEKTRVEIGAGPYGLQAVGQRVLFAGFTALYEEGRDEEGNGEPVLPALQKGQALELLEVELEQKTTLPPPRYTEATLVRELEEKGIGRPSTYASIIDTILKRTYVTKEKGRFLPTTMGMAVTDYLVTRFPDLVDVTFTAQMEDKLDSIEESEGTYEGVLSEFYDRHITGIDMVRDDEPFTWGETDKVCPLCGRGLIVRTSGKTGEFLACPGYPECRFTSNFKRGADGSVELVQQEERPERCPQCDSPMTLRQSRSGPFLGCSRYPECKGTMPLSSGVPCPREGCGGALVVKRSRKGRTFFGCNRYPECDYAVWDTPVARQCPACGFPIMTRKTSRGGEKLACPNKECGHRMGEDGAEVEDDG